MASSWPDPIHESRCAAPTRFILTAIGLLVAGVVTKHADDAAEVTALVTAGVCVAAWIQLSLVVVRRLKDVPPPG